MKKKLIIVSAALALLVMACGGGEEATPTPATPPLPTPALSPTPAVTPITGPSPTPTSTPILTTGLFVQVTNLPKESVVHTNTVRVDGRTSPDAIVSVNGIIVDVDEEGRFTAIVSLEEGTNIIEVIASDFAGNEDSAVLAIISIPE